MLSRALELSLVGIRLMRQFDQRAEAAEAIRGMLEQHRPQLPGNYPAMEALGFTALFVGATELLAPIASAFDPELGRFRAGMSTDSHLAGAQIFDWHHMGEDGDEYGFHPSLISLDQNSTYTIYTRWLAFLVFARTHRVHALGRGRAYVDVGDWSHGVGLCFCDNKPHASLIPDSSFMGSDGYAHLRAAPEARRPWPERKAVAFWRGSSTGVGPAGLMSTPRVRLCQAGQAAEAEGLIDAGITSVVQFTTEEEHDLLVASGLVKPAVPATSFSDHKYQIDIDGNTNSWPGLFSKLLTGSPVLKVESPERYRQWYYERLVPWHNYIPVAADLSDLIDKVKFLATHDDLARRIGEQGDALARSMTVESEVVASAHVVSGAFNAHRFVGVTRPR